MSLKFCKNLTLVAIHHYVQVITKQSSTEIRPALGRIWFNFTNGTAIQLDLYAGEVVSANVDNRIHYISKSLSPYF